MSAPTATQLVEHLQRQIAGGTLRLPATKVCLLHLSDTGTLIWFDGNNNRLERGAKDGAVYDAHIRIALPDLLTLLDEPKQAVKLMVSGKLKVENLPVALSFAHALKPAMAGLA